MQFKSSKTALYMASAFVALSTCPGIAFAQDNAAAEEEDRIVVTGTLIRGVEVASAQTIDVDAEDIAQAAASTTAELLGTLPQVSNTFNGRPDIDPRSADRQQVSRPNLRNLPGISSTTGHTTLLLVDGHRMTPMGVDQATFDPDFIPAGALERVEVVTDGGSSLYGADAVGGVINFITRRSFDGVELTGGFDTGDAYQAFNLGATAGFNWNGGGVWATYSYYDRENITKGDRDYTAQGTWDATGSILSPSGSTCPTPVGTITTWANFGAGWTDNALAASLGVKRVNVGSPCDLESAGTLLPGLERHSVMGGLTHDFSDSVRLVVKANWGDSSLTYTRAPQGDSVTEPNPNELRLPGMFRDTYDVASVSFSYGVNSAYVHRQQSVDLQVYGITPELTVDIGEFQLKTTGYWGESDSSRVLPSSDRTKLAAYVRSGALDPLNVAAASAAVITDINNFEVAGDATQSLLLLRSIIDGPLFALGEDEVRVALGVEYNRDRAALRSGSYAIGGINNVAYREGSRNVKSVFGELSIPLFSVADLSLSGRYDDYSDFGDTFNPTVGLSIEPVDGVRLYGRWGESFNAPTALDGVRVADARFIADAAAGVPDPNGERAATPTRNDVLLVEGSGGGLQPQTAETYTVGAEIEPSSGFRFGVNYYNIDFRNLLGSVNPQLASVVLLNPEKFIFNPTQAEYDAFIAVSANGAQFANINANDVGVIIDRRVANIGAAKLQGIDFHVDYSFETNGVDVSLGLSGNHQLSFDITENANTVDQLRFDNPDLTASTYVAVQAGGFTGRFSVNYTDGFDTNIAVNQTHVSSFTVADLFLAYELGENAGFLDGTTFRVAVDNLFDTEPPVYRQQRNLNYSGFTLGRIFKLGVTKRF